MMIGGFWRTGAAVAVIAAAGVVAVGTVKTEARTVAAAGPCSNVGLVMRPIRSSGATGHIGEMFRIHNVLPRACTLHGYPGAVLLDKDFFSLPTHVTWGLAFLAGKHAPVTVRLDATHDGYFILEWDHIPSPGETCPTAKHAVLTP